MWDEQDIEDTFPVCIGLIIAVVVCYHHWSKQELICCWDGHAVL